MAHEILIDRIYEAAVIPELWPEVLDGLAAMTGSFGGVFSATSSKDDVGRWTSSESLRDVMTDFAEDAELQANNLWLQRAIAARHHGFLGNDRLYGRDELERNLSYSKFFYPRGLGFCAGTVIPLPNGDIGVVNIERRHADGPVPDAAIAALDQVRPHLGRAAALAARLNLDHANNIVDALGNAGLPAAILAENAQVLAVNSRLEDMRQQFLFAAHDRIAAADRRANNLLFKAFEKIGSQSATSSIAIPAMPGSPAAVAHLLPLPGNAADVLRRAYALLLVTVLDRPVAPAAELLGGLFDLTAAEARVARAIAQGRSTEEAATELGLSRETIRWYLKSIFAKTGVSRQAELGALLSGAVLNKRPGALDG